MDNLQFIGLNKLDDLESSTVQRLTEKFYPKVDREFNGVNLSLDIKKHDPDGKRAKYSIHLKIVHPNIKNILTAKQFDWDLKTALHKTFDSLLNEVNHKFKKEVTQRKKKIF
jgi:hypothetical protein|tara:strand:- start:9609 stop:9944 length:336 start_codon:yes stop_codon:yes gene_type:complete